MAFGERFSPYVGRFISRARAVGIEALLIFCLDEQALVECVAVQVRARRHHTCLSPSRGQEHRAKLNGSNNLSAVLCVITISVLPRCKYTQEAHRTDMPLLVFGVLCAMQTRDCTLLFPGLLLVEPNCNIKNLSLLVADSAPRGYCLSGSPSILNKFTLPLVMPLALRASITAEIADFQRNLV
eukprot:2175246-Amphidinium_carterae.1